MIQRYIITVVGMLLNREDDSSWFSEERSKCECEGITCISIDAYIAADRRSIKQATTILISSGV